MLYENSYNEKEQELKKIFFNKITKLKKSELEEQPYYSFVEKIVDKIKSP